MSNVLHPTTEEFNELINSSQPVLVDFWAEWCPPCRALSPVIEGLADEFDGKITVAKINTDENNEVARRYNIMSIPTCIIFKNGAAVDVIVGAYPKEHYVSKINALI